MGGKGGKGGRGDDTTNTEDETDGYSKGGKDGKKGKGGKDSDSDFGDSSWDDTSDWDWDDEEWVKKSKNVDFKSEDDFAKHLMGHDGFWLSIILGISIFLVCLIPFLIWAYCTKCWGMTESYNQVDNDSIA